MPSVGVTQPEGDGPVAASEPVVAFIDPMCPYAYQTSRWLRSVREQSGRAIVWRFLSLEEINLEPHQIHPWERPWSYGWGQMRVGALIRRRHGQPGVDRWYAAVGAAFFEQERPTQDREVHRAVLVEAGFDPGLVDEAVDDPTTNDDVRADHDEAVASYGAHGVPTLVIHGRPVFGPVVVPGPSGAEALRLWDVVEGFASMDGVWELRRPKTDADVVGIAEAFAPYLRARSWRTIERPAR